MVKSGWKQTTCATIPLYSVPEAQLRGKLRYEDVSAWWKGMGAWKARGTWDTLIGGEMNEIVDVKNSREGEDRE